MSTDTAHPTRRSDRQQRLALYNYQISEWWASHDEAEAAVQAAFQAQRGMELIDFSLEGALELTFTTMREQRLARLDTMLTVWARFAAA